HHLPGPTPHKRHLRPYSRQPHLASRLTPDHHVGGLTSSLRVLSFSPVGAWRQFAVRHLRVSCAIVAAASARPPPSACCGIRVIRRAARDACTQLFAGLGIDIKKSGMNMNRIERIGLALGLVAVAAASGGWVAAPKAYAAPNCTVPGAHLDLHQSTGYDVTVD